MQSLPKGFRPLPAEQTVRRLRIDLTALGIEATFDDVLESDFWKDCIDMRVGDEIEIVAPAWTRTVRVTSTGPEGAVVMHIGGGPVASRTREVFLCREQPNLDHLWCLCTREGDDWVRLAPGQSNLASLFTELVNIITREPNTDVTLSPWDIGQIKTLAGDDQAASDSSILLPEGTADPERWRRASRDKFGERVGEALHRRTIPDALRAWFYGLSNRPYGTTEPDWKFIEKFWRPLNGTWLLIRPGWNARLLWPNQFKGEITFPPEIEAAAAAKRERDKLSRKRKFAQQRAAENAKFVEEWQHRQIEREREIYDK
jgi:hypothetical protein